MQTPNLITGPLLKGMFVAGSNWLKIHVDHINALNVFPVPDGDTGTNMLLTLQAALADICEGQDDHAGLLADRISKSALMGARGNSGIILSQIFCGFSETVRDKKTFSILEFAAALQSASDHAYKAVSHPVEGTILTIINQIAQAGQQFAGNMCRLDLFLSHILAEAKQALQLTPEQLPMLKVAGVVDSGGQGLVYFLEGMLYQVKGGSIHMATKTDKGSNTPTWPHYDRFEKPRYNYDVQFLITGEQLNPDIIRKTINTMGDSTVVVGDEQLIKVHVHVPDPNLPLMFGAAQGVVSDVIVEDMAAQVQALKHKHTWDEEPASVPHTNKARVAAICVTDGPGLASIFKSLGASVVINNGSSGHRTKPSEQDFLEAINQVKTNHALILPNSAHTFFIAQQFAQQAPNPLSVRVEVVPTFTIPAGIGAILSFNPEEDLETNLKRMQRAAQQVNTLEIISAVHTSTIHDAAVGHDKFIALANDKSVATGQSAEQVSIEALAAFNMAEFELLTIYYGAGVTLEKANALSQTIKTIHPNLEIEVLDGGQSHSPYIISLD